MAKQRTMKVQTDAYLLGGNTDGLEGCRLWLFCSLLAWTMLASWHLNSKYQQRLPIKKMGVFSFKFFFVLLVQLGKIKSLLIKTWYNYFPCLYMNYYKHWNASSQLLPLIASWRPSSALLSLCWPASFFSSSSWMVLMVLSWFCCWCLLLVSSNQAKRVRNYKEITNF